MADPIALLQTNEYRALLDQCIHCGMCLESCPTYGVFGSEMDSPRGRIALMRAAADGRVPVGKDSTFATHIERCLGCLSCESACPSGVQYGELVDEARAVLAHDHTPGLPERALRWVGLRQLMPHTERLKWLARGAWLYQRSGAQRLVRNSPLLPTALRSMERILPPITPRYRSYRATAPAIGPKRGTVAFMVGCIQEAFLAQVNQASVRVLQHNGFDVVFPHGQTCCGAAQVHNGENEIARSLARANIDACLALDVDAIISNAGGCGLTLKEYAHLLHDDADYSARAAMFVEKVFDISEFLVAHALVAPTHAVPATVTYVDSCHLRHGQRVVKQPRAILQSVPELRLVELSRPDQCCGSAGTYNISQPGIAAQVLAAKMADVRGTGAEIVAVSNTGCHMQLIAGVREAGLDARVLHIVQILDMAYGGREA